MGLVGGPLVKALIKRHNLKPENSDDSFKDYSKVESNEVLHRKYQPTQVFFIQLTIIALCMSVGTWIGDQFSNLTGQSLPMYVAQCL